MPKSRTSSQQTDRQDEPVFLVWLFIHNDDDRHPIAQRLVGSEITIPDGEGKPQRCKVEPYYTGGPTRFVTEKTEAIPNSDLAHKITNLVPGKRFVIEEQRFGNTIGPKKRVVFEKPPGFTKMDVPDGHCVIKFWQKTSEHIIRRSAVGIPTRLGRAGQPISMKYL